MTSILHQLFSNAQMKELARILNLKLGSTETAFISDFVLAYIRFEALALKICHFYRCREKAINDKTRTSLNINEVKRAFSYFGVQISEETINFILDSKLVKRDEKSFRNLRNGIFHRLQKEDINEVKRHHNKIMKTFEEFFAAVSVKNLH